MKPGLWLSAGLTLLLVAAAVTVPRERPGGVQLEEGIALEACSGAQVQTVAGGVDGIAKEWCAEEATQPAEPGWVALVCAVLDPQTHAARPELGTRHVIMPRATWEAMKASSDAGSSP